MKLNRKEGKPKLEWVSEQEMHYDPNRRRVLLFPGAAICGGGNQQAIAGIIKCAEEAVEQVRFGDSQPLDIYIGMYDEAFQGFDEYKEHFSGSRAPTYYGRKFCDFALLPCLLKEGESFEQLSPEELKTRLSHATLLGYSFGTVINQNVTDYLLHRMQQLVQGGRPGWTDAAVADVLKELVSVSVGSIVRQNIPQPNATRFFFTAINDRRAAEVIQSESPEKAMVPRLMEECGYKLKESTSSHLAKRCGIPEENRYHIRAAMPKDDVAWQQRHWDGTLEERRMLGAPGALPPTYPEHEFTSFLYCHPSISTQLRTVMCNAVKRPTGIGNGEQLFTRVQLPYAAVYATLPRDGIPRPMTRM